jgi:hypothetical protein
VALEAAYQDLPSEMMRGGGRGTIWRQQPVFLLIFILSPLLGIRAWSIKIVLNHLISICLVVNPFLS